MKRRCLAGAVGFLLLLRAPTFGSVVTSAADQKKIHDAQVAWAGDWTSGDVRKIISHYADDAWVALPDHPPFMKGKDAIQTWIKGLLADANLSLSFTTSPIEVVAGGYLPYARSTYSMTHTDPRTKQPIMHHGEYVSVYRKLAGGYWVIAHQWFSQDPYIDPVPLRHHVPADMGSLSPGWELLEHAGSAEISVKPGILEKSASSGESGRVL